MHFTPKKINNQQLIIMKKFTLLFFRIVLVCFALLIGTNKAHGLKWSFSNDYHFISDNTTDGNAQFYVDRYDGGNKIEHYLYFQVQKNGVWENVFRIYHYVDGSNFYNFTTLNGHSATYVNYSQTLDTDGDGDESEYVFKFTINGSPTDQYNIPVMCRFKEVDGYEWKEFPVFTLTFYRPNAPQNLRVSQNLCNKVDLTWEAPSNVRTNGTNYYRIYRNDSYIAEVSGTTFSYSNTSVTDGQVYDYQVRMRTYLNGSNYGEYSNKVAGRSKPVPEPPSGVTASTDRCDGTVFIQWQWVGEAPNNFCIARSTSESGTYSILSSSIPGDQTFYEDTPPDRNKSYFYKVITENDCNDWGDYSSPTEGIAADIPETPTGIDYSILNSVITISWSDNTIVEDKYILTRTNTNTGVTTEFELDANTTQYNDEEASLCQPYKYEIKAVNKCGSSDSDETDEIILPPVLSNTFSSGALLASKGYYADRVQLDWEVANNRNQLESFLIYRKVYGTSDSTLIATVNSTVSNFEDRYASNSIIYVYTIKGEGICNGNYVYSNIANDIGFKIPTGVVSGKVTYQNGNATQGVTVTAESTEIPDFSSIALNGTNGYISIPDAGISLQNEFTIQLMARFRQNSADGLFNKGNQYNLYYSSGTLNFSVGGTLLSVPFTPPIDTFVQISAIFDGSASFLYINGELKNQNNAVSPPADNSSDFVFGKNNTDYLNGYVDEIRLWSEKLDTNQVANNYRSYIKGNEKGLFGYYRLNENVNIDKIFDLSKTGDNYNGNHGSLMGGASYSTVIPTIEQLWFRAITDDNGNYLITGIPYLSGGSNYKIIPMFAPHEFDPTNKTLYIGDGATIHNNIDFIDISTVPVSVNVFYENTNWGVKEVRVLVDGQLQFDKNNRIVQTNESGMVDLEVPIGDHYLSFEKANHKFANPYFPGLETNGDIKRYNFIEPRATPIPVVDTTTVKLAGKIVGGPIEAEKDLLSNVNPTKNNLGVVNIQLVPEKAGVYYVDGDGNYDRDYIINTSTNPNTGYYELELLPEKYKPNGVLAIKNSLHMFNSDEDLALIDLSMQFYDKYESDSVFVNNVFSHMDTTAIYNLRRDWIKRSEPEFSVLNKEGGKIISSPEFEYVGETITETIPLAEERGDSVYYYFGKPVFFFAQEYTIALKAFELYINADDNSEDQVPVTDGRIEVVNELDLIQSDNELDLDENGEAEYTFIANFPNIANPYTRNLTITFIAGPTVVNWPQKGPYSAYIMGGRPTGNNFVTTGPALVDYILRDPPGSGSNASLEVGHVNTSTFSYGISNTTEAALGLQYNLGVKLVTEAGTPFFSVQTDTEAGTSIGGGIEASISLGGGYEEVHTTTTTEVISTSDDPDFDGRDGDVFVGHSTNIIYGLSKIMGIKPQSEVKGDSIIATAGANVITKVDGLRLTPEFDTYFIYSQRIIEEEMLPHLKMLRDNIFANSGNYTNHCGCTPADPKYASKNDDALIWGSNASDVLNDGPSYTYTPANDTLIDSVRYFNNQIENWIAILAQNEKQKTEAKADANHQNISFGAGSVYESSIGSEYERSDKFTYEVSVGIEIATQVDFDFNGNGFELTASLKNTTNQTIESSDGTVESQTVSYTLSDQDAENYLTVDVLKCQSGNGPVFKTRGGQTSCPYEGEELTRYF